MGDGGGGNDPRNNAQNKKSLLGKMLRIDPLPGGGYAIPADNPYVGRKGRNEIWSRGLRNPWRWSFDTPGLGGTGDLWIGDVGQGAREEVDRQPVSSDGGENYGWRRMEGTRRNVGKRLPGRKHTKPVYQYAHSAGCRSVTGGFVYRGTAIADLVGAYVFGDFCLGDIYAFPAGDPSQVRTLLAGAEPFALYSFGQDAGGELYVLSAGGVVSRIDPV
jgi:glucose/arabinose dehydrogenase